MDVWRHSYGRTSDPEADRSDTGIGEQVRTLLSSLNTEIGRYSVVREHEPDEARTCTYCITDGQQVEKVHEYGEELRLFGVQVQFDKHGENDYCTSCDTSYLEGPDGAEDDELDEAVDRELTALELS